MLTDNKVGISIIDVLENQIQRFDLLYSEYIEMWRKNNEEDRVNAKKKLKILNVLIWKQDKLFFVCLNILFNISSNPAIEKKMRKAGLVQILIRCLERNDFHLLIVTLGFLRKLSVIAEYKDQMVNIPPFSWQSASLKNCNVSSPAKTKSCSIFPSWSTTTSASTKGPEKPSKKQG